MNGAGPMQVVVKAYDGDAILGPRRRAKRDHGPPTSSPRPARPRSTSPGATGRVDVNLDHITGANLTTVDAARGAAVNVANGPLTIERLRRRAMDAQVNGGGDTRLVSADVAGDLTVTSTTGGLRFGDATPGRVIEVGGLLSLSAATDIAQQGDLHAFALGATAGTGVVLLGDNQVQYLDAIDVAAGGFAFHDALGFELNGAVDAVGQTVDLRSDGAITQASTGTITAQTLMGLPGWARSHVSGPSTRWPSWATSATPAAAC